MRWTDIHDPKGKIEIRADLSRLKPFYSPETVQKIINEHGFDGLVKIIDENLWSMKSTYGLQLIHNKDRGILIEYTRTMNLVG